MIKKFKHLILRIVLYWLLIMLAITISWFMRVNCYTHILYAGLSFFFILDILGGILLFFNDLWNLEGLEEQTKKEIRLKIGIQYNLNERQIKLLRNCGVIAAVCYAVIILTNSMHFCTGMGL